MKNKVRQSRKKKKTNQDVIEFLQGYDRQSNATGNAWVMLYQQKTGSAQSNVHPYIPVCSLLHDIVIHNGFDLESR
jgi:hypothetical protein